MFGEKMKYYERHKLGIKNEYLVQAWLVNQGYYVYTSKGGPIDIIALHSETKKTLYIDVKTLSYRKNGSKASTTRPLKFDFIKIVTVDPKTKEIYFNEVE